MILYDDIYYMILKLLYDIDIPFTTDGLKRVYVWGNW